MSRRISDLSLSELASHLRSSGVIVDSGAVLTRIISPLRETALAIRRNYGDYPFIAPDSLPDFRCVIRGGRGVHRWFRRQVFPELGLPAPFVPLPARMAAVSVESALNFCVAARAHWLVVFHAAVVEKGGRALVLPGDTGQGKSTLCAALVAAGWRLFSDEFCLFDPQTGRIHPNVRPISLKNQSIDVIRRHTGADVLTPPIPGTPKGTIAYWPPGPESIDRRRETARPLAVIFPHFERGQESAITEIHKARAFIRVVGNSVNYDLHGEAGFQAMADFMDRCPTYHLVYPDLAQALQHVEDIERTAAPA